VISGRGKLRFSQIRSKEIKVLQIQATFNPLLRCKVFAGKVTKEEIPERFGRFAVENLQFNILLNLLAHCFS